MAQVSQLSGVCEADLLDLMDYGVLSSTESDDEVLVFNLGCAMTLQHAQVLRRDLALDNHAFALAVMFLNEISELEAQLRDVHKNARACSFDNVFTS